MSFQISAIISVFIELGIMIYYANFLFYPKKSYKRSNFWTVLAYVILMVITQLSIPNLNIISFVLATFLLLKFCYKTTVKMAVVHTSVMTIMMMLCEFVSLIIFNLQAKVNVLDTISVLSAIEMGLIAKSIHFVLALLIVYAISKYRKQDTDGYLWLTIMPLTTFAFLMLTNDVMPRLTMIQKTQYGIISFLFMGCNLLVYWIHTQIVKKNKEIQSLKEIEHREELDYERYRGIEEKYNEMSKMSHDFNKYCTVIETLLEEGPKQVIKFLNEIRHHTRKLDVVGYTDRVTLNIVLSQKMEECYKLGIQLQIYIQKVDIRFFSEMDIVTIFSNLLDNAIESAVLCKEKKITLDLYRVNENYVTIKVTNSCERKPVQKKDGTLKTTKTEEKKKHGLGIKSIERALENYEGKMQWFYEEEKKRFTAIVIVFKDAVKNKV